MVCAVVATPKQPVPRRCPLEKLRRFGRCFCRASFWRSCSHRPPRVVVVAAAAAAAAASRHNCHSTPSWFHSSDSSSAFDECTQLLHRRDRSINQASRRTSEQASKQASQPSTDSGSGFFSFAATLNSTSRRAHLMTLRESVKDSLTQFTTNSRSGFGSRGPKTEAICFFQTDWNRFASGTLRTDCACPVMHAQHVDRVEGEVAEQRDQ